MDVTSSTVVLVPLGSVQVAVTTLAAAQFDIGDASGEHHRWRRRARAEYGHVDVHSAGIEVRHPHHLDALGVLHDPVETTEDVVNNFGIRISSDDRVPVGCRQSRVDPGGCDPATDSFVPANGMHNVIRAV
jgi:hypothetical protein